MTPSANALAINDQVRYEAQGRPRHGFVTAIRHDTAPYQTFVAVAPAMGGPRIWLEIERLTAVSAA